MTKDILIVDDHQLFRDGIRNMLETRSDLRVAAEAIDGRSAVNLAIEVCPDLILMDVLLPGLNGIDATRRIISEMPSMKILGFSRMSNEKLATEMLQAGACGYLVKDTGIYELMSAIDMVLRNEIYVSPQLTGLIIRSISGKSPSAKTKLPTLTKREREVLQLLTEGGTTKTIAALLYVSSKTIETHRKNIMDKLNIRSVSELTKYAIREGLTSIEY